MVMEPVQSFRSMQVYIHLILGLTKWLFSFEPNQSEFKNTHKASSALPNILKISSHLIFSLAHFFETGAAVALTSMLSMNCG